MIDTLTFKNRLQELGFKDELAEGLVLLFASHLQNVATKSDLMESEERQATKLEILEQRLTNRIYTAMIGTVTLLAAFMKFFD